MKVKVGLVQMSCVKDKETNIRKAEAEIRKAANSGANIVCLQELFSSLYFCDVEDYANFDLAEKIPGDTTSRFGKLAKELGVVIIASLFEKRAEGLYHNTTAVIDADGEYLGMYRKMHIPDDPAYYEKFYFTPGDLGFKPIDTSVGRLGVLVCWDQWYPEAARLMALQGAEILIYPTAIGYADNDTPDEQQRQRRAWQTVQRGHAVANGLPVVAANRVGVEGKNDLRRVDEQRQIIKNEEGIKHSESSILQQEERINFWGTSFVAGPQGELLHESPDDAEERTVVTIDMERCEQVRRWWPFLRDRRIDEYKEITKRFID